MDPVYHFRSLEDVELLIEQVSPLFPQEGKIRLGLRELMINAIEHGNLEIHYEEKTRLIQQGCWKSEIIKRLALAKYENRIATVSFHRHQQTIQIEIRDQGKGFQWQPYLYNSAERILHPHGRGIALARHFCFDSLEYSPLGNSVKASVFLG